MALNAHPAFPYTPAGTAIPAPPWTAHPVSDDPFCDEIPPDVQPKPPLEQFEALYSCPGCLGEEPTPHLATASYQGVAKQ